MIRRCSEYRGPSVDYSAIHPHRGLRSVQTLHVAAYTGLFLTGAATRKPLHFGASDAGKSVEPWEEYFGIYSRLSRNHLGSYAVLRKSELYTPYC